MIWAIPLFFILFYGLLIWLVPGIIGGIITALGVKYSGEGVDFGEFLKIAFGWSMGMTIGGIVGLAAYAAFLSVLTAEVSWKISYSITGMITGLVGSWSMYKELEAKRTRE